MSFVQEFKEFAVKGNVMDMAVGVIIGGAFGKIVTSLVNDIIMPPIGMLVGNGFADQKYVLREAVAEQLSETGEVITAAVPEIAMTYGNFLQSAVDFLIIAFILFMVIKGMNKLRRQPDPEPETPVAPVEDPADIALLKEIRDELRKRNNG